VVWKKAGLIEANSIDLMQMAFTPDGGAIIVNGLKGLGIYGVATGLPIVTFENLRQEHTDATLQVSADGKIVGTADTRRGPIVWDLTTNKERHAFEWPKPRMEDVRIVGGHATCGIVSPDGARAAAGWTDGRVRIWDLTTGKEVLTIKVSGDTRGIAYSPDGKILATMPSFAAEGKLWDAATGKAIATLPMAPLPKYRHHALGLRFSPDGKTLGSVIHGIVQDKVIAGVQLWDVETGKLKRFVSARGVTLSGFAIAPDGKTLAAAAHHTGITRLVNLETGEDRAVLKWEGAEVYGVAFSPDGKTVAVGSRKGEIQFWKATVEEKR
jgi:WD40 repeat protein